jgi:hypothetical protein
METTEINESHIPAEPKGILLLEDAQYFLHQAGKWATFLGIIGFIASGIIALGGIFLSLVFSMMPQLQGTALPFAGMGAMGGIIGFIYILMAVFYFFISRYLYQFGERIKKGIEYSNANEVSGGLGNLKSFFKLSGVFVIVILSLYVLVIIGIIVFGAFLHR